MVIPPDLVMCVFKWISYDDRCKMRKSSSVLSRYGYVVLFRGIGLEFNLKSYLTSLISILPASQTRWRCSLLQKWTSPTQSIALVPTFFAFLNKAGSASQVIAVGIFNRRT
ncbi:hypothetical protein GYMLUDRAFT_413882 [Collybiopsis luxurians FD-317 M1]|nr:hypothetical protein GYMLUDRAFT_413882 [Collybiopsis luxurians FD-317 M1]